MMRIFALLALGVSLAGIQVSAQPHLPAQTDQTISEMTLLTVTNTAVPASSNNLTYLLLQPPAGASIDTNGVIRWFPSEQQGPTNVIISTALFDGTTLLDTNSFAVTVTESNTAPVLFFTFDQQIHALSTFTQTNTASDSDIPTNTLSYQLINPPSGATIDANGVITWTPGTNDIGTTNKIMTVVTDNGSPPLSGTNSFVLTVLPPDNGSKTNVLLGLTLSLSTFIQNVTELATNVGVLTVDPGRIGMGDIIKAIAKDLSTNPPVGGKLYFVTDISGASQGTIILRTTDKDYDLTSSNIFFIERPALGEFGQHNEVTTDRPNLKAGTDNQTSYTLIRFGLRTSTVTLELEGFASLRATSVKDKNKLVTSAAFPSSITVAVVGSGTVPGAKGRAKVVVRGSAILSGRKVEVVNKN